MNFIDVDFKVTGGKLHKHAVLLKEAGITFLVTLIATVIVTAVYNFAAESSFSIDWAASVRFAIIFAIVIPVVHYMDVRKKAN